MTLINVHINCRLSKNHQGQVIRREPHFNVKVAFQAKTRTLRPQKHRDFRHEPE